MLIASRKSRAHGWIGRAAALAFVAATALVVTACTGRVDVSTHASPQISPTGTFEGVDGLAIPMSMPGGEFADADHGYLTLGRCPSATCETWVAVTEDRGESWHAAVIPDVLFGPGLSSPLEHGFPYPPGALHVLDATHAVYEVSNPYAPRPVGEAAPLTRWHTADAGRTWVKVPTTPVAMLDELPAAGYVSAGFAELGVYDAVQITVINVDGTSGLLRTPPKVAPGVTVVELLTAKDGGRWLVETGANVFALYRTQDNGRTWSQLALPDGGPGEAGHYWFSPGDGEHWYLAALTKDQALAGLWRGSRGSASWEKLSVQLPSPVQFEDPGSGGLVAEVISFTGPPIHIDFFSITATGTSFTPDDGSALTRGRTRSFFGTSEPGWSQAMGRQLPGVWRVDGSFIALPFACLTSTAETLPCVRSA
jgi:hypothetical protein